MTQKQGNTPDVLSHQEAEPGSQGDPACPGRAGTASGTALKQAGWYCHLGTCRAGGRNWITQSYGMWWPGKNVSPGLTPPHHFSAKTQRLCLCHPSDLLSVELRLPSSDSSCPFPLWAAVFRQSPCGFCPIIPQSSPGPVVTVLALHRHRPCGWKRVAPFRPHA